MEQIPGIATAICHINMVNQEHYVDIHGWPETLQAGGAELLELESQLFRSGAREVILRRSDGFARFILADDSAELRVQESPGPQPIRTLRYTLEGWFPYPE
jgi:hypothetical protein